MASHSATGDVVAYVVEPVFSVVLDHHTVVFILNNRARGLS